MLDSTQRSLGHDVRHAQAFTIEVTVAKAQTPVNMAVTAADVTRDRPAPQRLPPPVSMKRTDGERRGQRAPGVITRSNQRLTHAIERLTRRNEHLTQVGEAKARFFANVSHELRTPLALILGPVEKHLRETPDMDAGLRRDLEVVQRNARTVLRHVNDLLDVAKIEAGRGTSDYTRTDAAALVREVSRHFSALADEQHITFVVEAPARLLVDTDAVKLHSIVLNLLSNAFKFTPAGGRVRVTLREAGQRVQLEVGDSGPGIPVDQRQAVFDRFEQIEGEATRRHAGTGLGLAIVRDFAALLGGTVSAGEAPECGALFVVDLPIAASAGTIVRPAAGESAVRQPSRTSSTRSARRE